MGRQVKLLPIHEGWENMGTNCQRGATCWRCFGTRMESTLHESGISQKPFRENHGHQDIYKRGQGSVRDTSNVQSPRAVSHPAAYLEPTHGTTRGQKIQECLEKPEESCGDVWPKKESLGAEHQILFDVQQGTWTTETWKKTQALGHRQMFQNREREKSNTTSTLVFFQTKLHVLKKRAWNV